MIQLQVLNKILKDKDSSFIVDNNLDNSYFSDYQNEFNFIINHLNKYNSIPDLATFLNVFEDFTVLQVDEPDSYLLEKLEEDRTQRKLAFSFNKIRELLMKDDTNGALNYFKSTFQDVSTSSSKVQCVDILKDTSRYDKYIERTQDYNKYYIRTGFKELDNIIGGWDREEELAVVAARTNVGKSFILIKMALEAVKQGLNVLLYSGEMSEKKVGYRMDTLISHIPNTSLIRGRSDAQVEYKKYIDSLSTMFKGYFKIVTPQMLNGPATVGALGNLIDKEKPDILFIDQHSLLEDQRKAKTPVERASNISRDLKNLQVMKRIPIISVSQLNRTKNEDDTIDTTQLSMSDRISQDATIIIGLSRDKKDKNLMSLQIVKARDAEAGRILKYNVDFNTGIYTYIPEEEDDINQETMKDYIYRYNIEDELL